MSMHWLSIMAIAVVLRAFYSLGAKSSTTRLRIHHTTLSTLLVFGSAFLALLISPFIGGLDFSGLSEHWGKALVMVVSLGVGNVIYFKGQDMVDAGTTQIALATKLVWTALLAIPILGISYDGLQILGMFVLAAAILLVGRGITSKTVSLGAVIIAISAVSFSFNSLFSADVANEVSPVAYLLVSYIGAGLISLLSGLKYLKEDYLYMKADLGKTVKYGGLTAAINLAYFVSIYYAFDAANESRGLVAVLTNAQVVPTVIAATIFLGERDNLVRKVIAGLLVRVASDLIAGV